MKYFNYFGTKNIFYFINLFSENSTQTEKVDKTDSRTTCEYFGNYPKHNNEDIIEPFLANVSSMGAIPYNSSSSSSSDVAYSAVSSMLSSIQKSIT